MLVLCLSKYSDCEDKSWKEEFVVSVAVIRKLVCLPRITFASVADEFSDPTEWESTLLLIHLHHQSKLFLDIYFDRYSNHFTMMHVSSEQYNVGHPQKYVGPHSTMLMKLGESHNPRKLNCLQPTWTVRCTNYQWIPVCSHMKIGRGALRASPHWPNILSFYQRMSLTGWCRLGRHHGSLTPRNIQSRSVRALTLQARVLEVVPGKESGGRNITIGGDQSLR